jgi:anti-sigma B factor antagonist
MSSFYVISDDTTDRNVALIALGGDIDFAASPALRDRISAHLKAGRRRVIVDLSDVTFIDSSAIGVLLGTVSRLRESGGGSVAVVCPERRRSMSVVVPQDGAGTVRQIFEVTGMDAGVALCSTREEALAEILATA